VPFQRLGLAGGEPTTRHVLIALDGTEYFCSQKLSCPNCSSRARANGKTEYFHQMVSAALVAPGHDRALPLEPEFIVPQDGADVPSIEQKIKQGARFATYRYRWLEAVPIRDGDDALLVNWLEIEIVDHNGKVTYRNSFVTDLPVNKDNVVELAACGRSRWKIENETFNTLKTKGYNLEHNFGHGQDRLSATLATLNLLAFAFHTAADLVDAAWMAARAAVGTRKRFFEDLRALTTYLVFPTWAALIETLRSGLPPPQAIRDD
jgi:hypothetical protein